MLLQIVVLLLVGKDQALVVHPPKAVNCVRCCKLNTTNLPCAVIKHNCKQGEVCVAKNYCRSFNYEKDTMVEGKVTQCGRVRNIEDYREVIQPPKAVDCLRCCKSNATDLPCAVYDCKDYTTCLANYCRSYNYEKDKMVEGKVSYCGRINNVENYRKTPKLHGAASFQCRESELLDDDRLNYKSHLESSEDRIDKMKCQMRLIEDEQKWLTGDGKKFRSIRIGHKHDYEFSEEECDYESKVQWKLDVYELLKCNNDDYFDLQEFRNRFRNTEKRLREYINAECALVELIANKVEREPNDINGGKYFEMCQSYARSL